jgi:outer membrane biosynthesis protein TonB
MTIDELIQRSGGQYIPVEDRVQIKEITKLNKSIQALIVKVDKSTEQDKETNTKLSDRIKKLVEEVVKKPAERIAPAKRIAVPTKTETKKKDDKETSRIDNLEKKFGDFLKTMTKKGPFAGLQPKQMASTVDPSKKKEEDEEGGSMIVRLLAGALLGYMAAANWDKIKDIMKPAFEKLKQVIEGAIGQELKDLGEKAREKVNEMLGTDDWSFSDMGKAALGAAGVAYGASKVLPAAGRMGAAAGKRLAGALGLGGAAAELEAERQKRKEKEIEEEKRRRRDAEGKREAEKARKAQQQKPQTRIEPTLDKPTKKVETPAEKPKVDKPQPRAKPTPVPILEKPKVEEPKVETQEQKEAREKAIRKAQEEQRSRMEADRAKSKKTIDDVSSRRKPSLTDKLKTGADAVKGQMGKVGKVAMAGLRKAGPLAALAFGAYDSAKAATGAEEILGIEGRKATLGERLAAGVGGLTEGLTFGLVPKEKVAQGISGATNMQNRYRQTTDAKPVDREKVVQAIEQKAMDEKKRREINAEISRNKIEMHKMLRDGKKEQAMELARETVKLQDKLKAADRGQQPSTAVYQKSQENAELKMKTSASASGGYQGPGLFQNIVNNQNTSVQTAPTAQPRSLANSVERYLDKVR